MRNIQQIREIEFNREKERKRKRDTQVIRVGGMEVITYTNLDRS